MMTPRLGFTVGAGVGARPPLCLKTELTMLPRPEMGMFAPLVDDGAGVFAGCVATFSVPRPTNARICERARSDCDATSATLVTCAVWEKRITPLSTLTT